jgi:hypothetical protein
VGAEAYGRFVASGGATIAWIVLGVAVATVLVVLLAKPAASAAGGGPEERRIRKSGRPARGTVTAIAEGGGGQTVTVGDRQFLEFTVQVEDGVGLPYAATLTTLVPPEALARMQPGAVVPLKVDPRDQRKAVIDWPALGVEF